MSVLSFIAPGRVTRDAAPGSATSEGAASSGRGQLGREQRLNSLRAGVLGANDGIVSVAAVVVGVAGATTSSSAIMAAGLAAAIGGAVSMALGEYVSVSSQRDSEQHTVATERASLAEDPESAQRRIAASLQGRGMSEQTARTAAGELVAHDRLDAVLRELDGIDTTDVASPWHAAFASFIAFTIGALLPLLAILMPGAGVRVVSCFVVTLLALALTGVTAAAIGGGNRARAAARVVIGGALALAATYGAGLLLGATGVV